MNALQIKPRILAITLIILTSFSLFACSPATLKTQASETPQLIQAILSDPKTFNYVTSQEATTTEITALTNEGLVSQNPITNEIEPALAESWEISEDKLSIILTLRKGLKWSDGEPLTAEDVDFTYNQLYLNEEIPTGARDVLRVGQSRALPTVRKLNDLRVEFSLPEPFAPFLASTGFPIFPAHILRETIETRDSEGNLKFLSTWGVDTPPDKIIVNGRYKIKNYITSQRVTFERNPYYWKKDKQGNQLPYIDEIVWEIVESTDTFLLQFRSGSLDSVSVSPDYFSLLKKEEERGNFAIYNGGPSYGTTFFFFNLNTGSRNGKPLVEPNKSRWFNNLKFRQAVAHAVDRQRMINNIFRGLGQAQNSPISIQSPYYYDRVKSYDYNPEKAKEILKEAGFKYNNRNELLDADGNRVRFSLITNAGNKIREGIGAQIAQDLGKIGIRVDFTPIAWNTLTDKLSNSLQWDSAMLGLTGGNEPNSGANVWFPDGDLHMFNQYKKGIVGRKVADWEERIAQLYIQGAKELNENKRKVIYAEIQDLTQENLPLIYLVNPLSLGAVRNTIEPIQFSALGGAFWNVEELKITEN